MENVKKKRKKYLIWNSGVDMVVGLIVGVFTIGPGVVVGYYIFKYVDVINPPVGGGISPVGERLFFAILLGGLATLFFGLLATWRGR